jgi:hypothetical protein
LHPWPIPNTNKTPTPAGLRANLKSHTDSHNHKATLRHNEVPTPAPFLNNSAGNLNQDKASTRTLLLWHITHHKVTHKGRLRANMVLLRRVTFRMYQELIMQDNNSSKDKSRHGDNKVMGRIIRDSRGWSKGWERWRNLSIAGVLEVEPIECGFD